MAERRPRPGGQRAQSFVIACGAVLVAALIAVVVLINRANGTPPVAVKPSPTPTATASPTPTPSPTPVPTPTPAIIPFADCTTARFGAPLKPLTQPATVHVYAAAPAMTIDTTKLYEATITTARGSIVLCLQPALAPLSVNNFVTLTRNHFFDGIPFHRVCPNAADRSCGGSLAIIQGGDPNCIGNVHASSCGQGGPGYKFADEPVHQSYSAGSVAMANSGPNTNGSQFFIDTGPNQFPPNYNLFGDVASGLDVAKAIQQGDVVTSVTVRQQV